MPVRSRLVSVKSRLLWATPLAKRRVEQLGAAEGSRSFGSAAELAEHASRRGGAAPPPQFHQ